jgi:ubiquitin-conjugating enzyme E2 J2
MVHGDLKHISGHIQDVLTKIQSRLQWGSDKYECSDVERLAAEQNCEVVIAADEYYRKSVSEPPGSRASWNTRDQHMTTSLLRIQAHLNDPKMVIWAHNSHVGDSTATNRGGVGFERNETWNLGQMTRATFGADKVWIVGQYTNTGHVTASSSWGGPHRAHALNPALPDSYEEQLHRLQSVIGSDPFHFRTAVSSEPAAAAGSAAEAQLVGLLRAEARLQRWVGVNYKPETERQSHYGELMLSECYDQIVYIDTTSALTPVAEVATVSASSAACKRLVKEYRRLVRIPPPGIEAHPLDENILEFHFVLRCEQVPYAGGEYHGLLEFPPEYPMRPPAFKVLTPSGRFKPGVRLCLSMSDYHPESWNPSWSLETLLVGLQSFMYEESNAIGSLSASTAERERLAAGSHGFNKQNQIWQAIFGTGAATGSGAAADGEEEEKVQESVCRFCFTAGGELLSPCMCKGTNEWVHLECLRTWQKSVVLDQPTHPKYHTKIDQVCNVCLEPFTGIGEAPDRHEMMVSYTGAELAAMVTPGNLLVTSRESSREKLELMAKHPEIRGQLATWTKACFLMLSTGRDRKHLIAVSMSAPVDGPPADVRLTSRQKKFWSQLELGAGSYLYKLRHFDGGPMNRETPLGVIHVVDTAGVARGTTAAEWARCSGDVQAIAPGWLYLLRRAIDFAVLFSF